MFVSFAFVVDLHVDPTADVSYPLGALNGFGGRVLADTPKVLPSRARELLALTKREAPKIFGRLAQSDLFSTEEWIAMSPYTTAQKAQLTTMFNEFFPESHDLIIGKRREEFLLILSFIKKEFYPDFKMYRAILGRNDLSKLMLGCLVKSIESVVYDCEYFIKHIPWHDRPQFMREKFAKYARIIVCDFSSYEASIKFWLTRIEKIVYSHVTNSRVAKLICDALYSTNSMAFSWFKCEMDACRASGDTTTALGNALITLFVWLYVLEQSGIDIFSLVDEGDDNMVGTNSNNPIKEEIFVELGLIAKVEYPFAYNTASFCGMIFSETSSKIITDPIKVLNRFGWLDSKYARSNIRTVMSLYRGKALCMLYQYRDCPLLSSFARAVLRVTRRYTRKAKVVDKHHLNREYVPTDERRLPPSEPPDPESRMIIEELYGVSCEMQQLFEEYFDQQTDLFNIPHLGMFSDPQNANWKQNVTKAETRSYPPMKHLFSHYLQFLNHCSALNVRVWRLENMTYEVDGKIFKFRPHLKSNGDLDQLD
jgi:hypothetical protein